ncbi:membrane protein [Caballeronia ptereochthonis]|uniref:Membrane protein n=2 Tax=Caballeronia ptereochthonis TaxID=1777144 RepID=A0A157ZM36_9BURK|nr:membrane protein [Caballeronia ptereochthonis]
MMAGVWAWSCLVAVHAAQDDDPSTIVSDVHAFVVAEDGSLTEDDATVLRANTSAGVDEIAQRYVWYDRSVSKVEIVEAYSVDANGVRHDVSPDQMRDIQEPRSAGAPTFQDAKLRAVIFPAVGIGSTVHLRFRKSQAAAVIPGEFNYFVDPGQRPVLDQRLVFDLPADKPLHADARGYVAEPPVTENGRTRYAFDYRRERFARIESGSVGYAQYGDRLMVTTFPDYASFAKSYRDAAVDPGASDPAVRALAQSLTRNDADDRAKAKTLYDWVRRNIRYVAMFIGQSPAVPHRVTEVLANRYGDCKDHVALYGALLAAVGIRSEPALIGLGPVYALPSVPGYGSGAINHVITWLPDLNVYADSTASGVEFGFLPLADMDRPALRADSGVLSRTPATQALARTARLQIDVAPQGEASFAYWVEDAGWSAEIERMNLRLANAQRRDQIAADRLRFTNLRGAGALTTSDVDATGGPFATTLRGTLDDVVWPTGTTALPALTSLSGGIATQTRNWLAERTRTQPYICIGGSFDEVSQIALPKHMRVAGMPDDLDLTSGFFRYRSRYLLDPATNVIQISRTLEADFGKQVCSPEDFQAALPALRRIERDTQEQIIVRAAGR